MTHDTFLGMWHHVQGHAWFTYYWTKSAIYHQDADQGVFQVFHEKGTGFYHCADTVTDLPMKIPSLPARRSIRHIGFTVTYDSRTREIKSCSHMGWC